MKSLFFALAFSALAHPSSVAATGACAPDFAPDPQNKAAVARLYGASVTSVGMIGISDAELTELVRTGAIEAKTAKHWPRLIDGRDGLREFRAKNRRFEYHEDDADVQLKAATIDGWARSVADVLNARYATDLFATEAYLTFIRGLANDFDTVAEYSPKAVKIRRAAENSNVPLSGRNMGRLRSLGKVLDVTWANLEKQPVEFWREFEAKLAKLPSAGGAVLGLAPQALTNINWGERATPYLKRITLDDLASIAPATPEGFELLDRFKD